MDDSPRPGPAPLDVGDLYQSCDPETFSFVTTDEVADLDGAVGQPRALAALEFGVRMRGNGYNLYVLGRPGSHKHRIVKDFLESEAADKERPPDWCYLNNFQEDRKPHAISLPCGMADELKQDMSRLVEELREGIPAAFESEHYRNRTVEINQEFEDRHRAAIEELQKEAQEEGVSLVPTPHGFAIAPTRDGKLLSDEEFERFPDEEKERTAEAMGRMSDKLRHHIEQLPRWHKERREQIKALNREVTDLAARELIDRLRAKYAQFEQVNTYLDEVREDVLEHARDFQPADEREIAMPGLTGKPSLRRYEVNVLAENSTSAGAPIVYESNPSVQNLLGRVEHISQFGALVTDFTMIRPGALHRANGGYLILDAERVLLEPYAWNALKRTLFGREIRIESLGQLLSLVSTVSLEPEPIPLDVKVVLVGDRMIYYLLCEMDPDFGELFKVAADFENRIDRSAENTELYGQLVATLARREKLRPLNRGAVARVVEQGARLLGDAGKLTTRLRDITDLLRESDYWSAQASHEVIDAEHVQQAIDAQTHRLDRLRAELQEEIQRNDILIDTSGAKVGQINGLSVLELGNFSFGQPSRITATARMGEGKIIDIERETELGGPIHSKGVLIVSSYLTAKYAPTTPLSLAASLVFEQSYGGVEGDSGSVAETCALLSALSELPIHQYLAVTGSVNQHGQVQVIGGVNEKIEGFFDICNTRGLAGNEGVLIPKDNVQHLMLRRDVVEAAEQGQFHVYPVSSIDEAITILTGHPAGARGADGKFPKDTLNYRVERRLLALARRRQRYDQGKDKKRKKKNKTEQQSGPSG